MTPPLKTREFLEVVRDVALGALAEPPACRMRGSLLQLYYVTPDQHYEVWVRPRERLIELGLHFEGDRDDNYRRIAFLAGEMPAIAGALGPAVEVEEWTPRWTRVHETLAAPALTPDLAVEAGRRLASYVEVLEPFVRPLGPIAPPPAAARSGDFRGRRRRGIGRP